MRILYPRRKVSAEEKRQAVPPDAVCPAAYPRQARARVHRLRALYYRYLYELGALPKKPVYPGYAVRQDIRKLDQYVEQMPVSPAARDRLAGNSWQNTVGRCSTRSRC